jgi:hypothetical protein
MAPGRVRVWMVLVLVRVVVEVGVVVGGLVMTRGRPRNPMDDQKLWISLDPQRPYNQPHNQPTGQPLKPLYPPSTSRPTHP